MHYYLVQAVVMGVTLAWGSDMAEGSRGAHGACNIEDMGRGTVNGRLEKHTHLPSSTSLLSARRGLINAASSPFFVWFTLVLFSKRKDLLRVDCRLLGHLRWFVVNLGRHHPGPLTSAV